MLVYCEAGINGDVKTFGSYETSLAHSIALENLSPNTSYFYKILSADNAGNIARSDGAIFIALEMALENDVVLIAGKGHEDYQEFKDYRIPFSDKNVVNEWAAGKDERKNKN